MLLYFGTDNSSSSKPENCKNNCLILDEKAIHYIKDNVDKPGKMFIVFVNKSSTYYTNEHNFYLLNESYQMRCQNKVTVEYFKIV